jgi:hypothetical protein
MKDQLGKKTQLKKKVPTTRALSGQLVWAFFSFIYREIDRSFAPRFFDKRYSKRCGDCYARIPTIRGRRKVKLRVFYT